MTLNFMLCLFQHVIDLSIAGVQAPLGFWDPAGLSADGDAKEFGGGSYRFKLLTSVGFRLQVTSQFE